MNENLALKQTIKELLLQLREGCSAAMALLSHRLPLAAEMRGCPLVCSTVGGMRKPVLVWHVGLLQSLHSVIHRSSVL